MELIKYLKVILQWWWLEVISLIIVMSASFVFSYSQPPKFRSYVTLVVSPKETLGELTTVRQSLDTLDNPSIINTYAEVMRSRQIYDRTQESLNLPPETRGTIKISANVIPKTNLILLEAEGTDPTLVATMANAVADQGITYIDDLYQLYDVKVLDAAQVPTKSISPNVLRDTALGGVLGLMLGLMSAFLANYLRGPFKAGEMFSIIDVETGLYNKRFFQQRLREEINRSKRNGRPLAVCLMSLNDLNHLDSGGSNPLARTVRHQVAGMLKQQLRQEEIIARWTGDRFAWLLLESQGEALIQAVKRVKMFLEQATFEDKESGQKFLFTGNFGLAVYSNGKSNDELLSLAEEALQQAEFNYASGLVIKTTGESRPDSSSAQNRESGS